MTKVSLIVPCYNEEDNIKEFYDRTVEVFSKLSYEIEMIFIDDGSEDRTLEEMKKMKESGELITEIVSFSRNFGKEAAIYAGLERSDAEYTVVIDADMQQDPFLIIQMLRIIEREPEYDSVVYVQEDRAEGKIKAYFKNKFYKTINKLSDIEFVQGASDFRLLRKNVVKAILKLPERGRFSKGIFSWVGFKNKYIPYKAKPRKQGKTKWTFAKAINYAFSGISSFSAIPLKISSYIGGFLSIVSFLYLIAVVFEKIFIGIPIPGYPTIVTLILFVGGVQLLSLGVIGHYISEMFLEAKRRPIYIEKDIE